MAGQAGIDGSIEVATTSSFPGTTVGGCNSVSLNLERAMLEVTDFDDSWVDRVAGLLDAGFTFGGHADAADSGQGILRAAFFSGNTIFLQWLKDGTNGFEVQGKVANYSEDATPEGTTSFSCEISSVGAVSEVS